MYIYSELCTNSESIPFAAVNIESSCEMYKPHRWRNGVRLECGRSWVRVPVGSNQKL